MENENKELQGSVEETELQEKVRQDVSEKIAAAAAEVQDEIDSAEEVVEEAAEAAEVAEEDAEEDVITFADGEELEAEEEEVVVKEPKIVSLKLSNLVLSLIGTAVIGALLLWAGLQIPGWIEAMPEGSTVVSVEEVDVTDLDMKYYMYIAAMEYLQENDTAALEAPAEYDWTQDAGDGKTAEEVVRENAIQMAVEEAVLLNVGAANGLEADPSEMQMMEMQNQQMISTYGEELVLQNYKRQGLASQKHYVKKVEQAMLLQAVQTDMEENADAYYPEDRSALDAYASENGATSRQIFIAKETLEDEAAQAASNDEKRAKAEEALARIRSGEDFDAVLAEVSEDTAQTEEGYTVANGAQTGTADEAALNLAINDISEVIETEDGYYIVKRIAGSYELQEYLKEQAKVKVKDGKIAKLSLKTIFEEINAATEAFETLYQEYQTAQGQ